VGNGRYFLRDMISKDILKSVQHSICNEHHVGMVIYDHTLKPLTHPPKDFPGIEHLDQTHKDKLAAFYRIRSNQHSFTEGRDDYVSFINGLFLQITAPIYFKNQLVGVAVILKITKNLNSKKNAPLFTYISAAQKSKEGITALQDHTYPTENSETRFLLDELRKALDLLMDGNYQKLKLTERREEVQVAQEHHQKHIIFTEHQGFILEAVPSAVQTLHYRSIDALLGKNFFRDIIANEKDAKAVKKQLATVDSMLRVTLPLQTRDQRTESFHIEFHVQKDEQTIIGYEINMSSKQSHKTEGDKDRQAIHLIEDSFEKTEPLTEKLWLEDEPPSQPKAQHTDIQKAMESLTERVDPLSFSFKSLEKFLDAVPLPFFVLDQHKNICWWNRAIENLLHIPAITAIEHKFDNWIAKDMQAIWINHLQELQNSSKNVLDAFPLTIHDHNKNTKYLQVTLSKIEIFNGQYISVLLEPIDEKFSGSHFPDLTDEQNLFKKIRRSFESNDDQITRILSMSQRDAAKRLKALADKNQDINRQLSLFTGELQPQIKTIDVNKTVENIARRLQSVLAGSFRVHYELDETVHPLPADADLITLAVTALCKNAVEAMPEGGRLSLSTIKHKSGHELEYACIMVEDTGSGIHPDMIEQLYLPFTTTKGETGKGLGLAGVFGIIQNHGGKISFQTHAHGTRFQLFLPCGNGKQKKQKSGQDFKASVMIIDDDENVAEATASALKLRGYFAVLNTDAHAAAEMLRKHPNDFDILLVDYHLKGMTGITFVEKIKTFLNLPIIFYSGEKDLQLQKYIRDNGHLWMTKPFKTSELTELIDRAIHDD